MSSPPAPAPRVPRPGIASAVVECAGGTSRLTSCWACSPFRLLAPVGAGRSVWLFGSNLGGGLLAGDQTFLDLAVGDGARCFLGSQSSAKIYRSVGLRGSGHGMRAVLGAGAVLVVAPDPVQAFAGSSYRQRQEFELAEGAGLLVVDWLTSGRVARGERWAFRSYASVNQISACGRRVLIDSLRLDASEGPLDAPHRLGRMNCLAVVACLGPAFAVGARGLMERHSAVPAGRREATILSASPLGDGFVLRVAGEDVESVGRLLRRELGFVVPVLGDDPWARKW